MNRRLLRSFLGDRVPLIAGLYLATGLTLVLVSLLLRIEGMPTRALRPHAGYAFLLATAVAAAGLAVDLLRWLPYARQVQLLLDRAGALESLANLPPGGTADQAAGSMTCPPGAARPV